MLRGPVDGTSGMSLTAMKTATIAECSRRVQDLDGARRVGRDGGRYVPMRRRPPDDAGSRTGDTERQR